VCSIGFTVEGITRPAIDEMHPFDTLRRMYHDPVRMLPRMTRSRGLRAAAPVRVGQLMRKVPMPDFAARLDQIVVPTAVIWGRQDGIIPLAVGEALAGRIRGAELSVIEQCGHLPHVEQPSEFNDHIRRLLDRVAMPADGATR
jgi:pimeloyl-ACP methyl ester carboxylesterase